MTRSGIPQQLSRLPLQGLIDTAGSLRDQGWGRQVSYSRKVFIPLTELCRDVCHYCTYAKTPKRLENIYLTPEQVLDIARAGKAQAVPARRCSRWVTNPSCATRRRVRRWLNSAARRRSSTSSVPRGPCSTRRACCRT